MSTAALDPGADPDASAVPCALLVGFSDADLAALRASVGGEYDLLSVSEADLERAAQLLKSRRIAVFCLGERLSGEPARQFLEEVTEGLPVPAPLNLVLASGPDPTIFQDLISEDRIFYLTQRPPSNGELSALLRNAVQRFQSQLERLRGERMAAERQAAARNLLFAETLRRIGPQRDPAERAEILAEGIEELVGADRAYCLLYDPSDETLWGKDPVTRGERRESAAVGLASFVLRSGLPVRVARTGQDPRYDRDIDDPQGRGDERLLAVPLLTANGRAAAVLVAARTGEKPEFSDDDRQALEQLATLAAPQMTTHLLEGESESGGIVAALAGLQGDLFRKEALDHHLQANEAQQDPLMISPTWQRWTYWSLLALLVTALVYSLVGEVHEYAQGQGVVWMGGRSDISVVEAGTVADVAVDAGKQVEAGDVLVRFYEGQEAAELERIEQNFELQLTNRLRDPSDRSAEQALLSLRTERELAQSRLEERYLRAPISGKVSDLRVREGQYVTPGQFVLSILPQGAQADPAVVILVPGEYRPQIKPGMPIRFEISGYQYAYQSLRVSSVGDEVVGPNEARRYFGPGLSDSVSLTGPVVLVEAKLPSATFEAEGKTYRYANGMRGIAEVRVRSEKILITLVPGLKYLFGREDA